MRYSLGALGLLVVSLPAGVTDGARPIILDAKNWNPSFVVFTADGKSVLAWDDLGILKAWTVTTGKEDAALSKIKTIGKGHAVSADGRTVYLSELFGENGTFLDLETLKVRKAPGSTNPMHTAPSSDGGRIAWLSHPLFQGGGLVVWDTAKDAAVQPSIALPLDGGHPYARPLPVHSAALSADGKVLATGHPNGYRKAKISVWDLGSGKEQAALLLDDEDAGLLRFTADGKTLVSASGLQFGTGTVRMWDVATGKLRVSLGGYGRRVFAVALTTDGKWLATGDEAGGKIRVFEVAKGNNHPVATLESQSGDSVACLAFSPDGKWLASVSARERGVRLWDIATLKDQPTKK